MRAGIRMRISAIAERLIRVARRAANWLIVHCPPVSPLPSFPSMNSFEINKVLGALLGTWLVLVAMHIASGAIFTPEKPAKPGYEIAVTEEAPQGGAAPAEVPIEN